MGYTPGRLLGAKTPVRPIGDTILDHINGRNITFAFSQRLARCNLALTGVGQGVHISGGWVRNQLTNAGYTQVEGGSRREFIYENGALELVMTGTQVGGQTVISLHRSK